MTGLRGTDLAAGLVAVAVLLATVLLLGQPVAIELAVGGLLALLAYAGTRLALPPPHPDPNAVSEGEVRRALGDSERRIDEIRALADGLPPTAGRRVRGRILGICSSATRIVDAIRRDPDKREAAKPFVSWLSRIHSIVTLYATLSARELETARGALTAIEDETLPQFEEELKRLYERIHIDDINKLLAEGEAVFYRLESIEAGSRDSGATLS